MDKKTQEKIWDVLVSEDFDVWYKSDFLDHVEGGEDAPTKEETLEHIGELFSRVC